LAAADDLDGNRREAGALHADHAGSALRKVDDATFDERAAVVDRDHDGLAVALVGDAHLGAEGERAVSGGESVRIELAAGRDLLRLPVVRGDAVRAATR